jgi:hypothetical protein
MIRQVKSEQSIIDRWTFGGGSAMMVQIGHRESHDVDIFLPDAQLLPFLDPQKRDFDFEILPSNYTGDGTTFLKLLLRSVKLILLLRNRDFIANDKNDRRRRGRFIGNNSGDHREENLSSRRQHHAPRHFRHRSRARTPRGCHHRELRSYPDEVARTLAAIERQNPEFVNATIAQLSIKDP